MSGKRLAGYWVIVGAATVLASAAAYFFGDAINPSPTIRVLAVVLCGVILLCMEGLVRGALKWTMRSGDSKKARYARDPNARIGSTSGPGQTPLATWDSLAKALRARHGRRWRYRRPWLLLDGDPALIDRLSPKSGTPGWTITDNAVLLWSRPLSDGQANSEWLRELAKLRRGCPLDAVVALVDGDEGAQALSYGLSDSIGYRIGRTAELLNWATPVYVVSVDSIWPTSPNSAEVIGCEFGSEVEAGLVTQRLNQLRERLADLGIRRLGQDKRDRYGAELSRSLDKRIRPLAEFIVRLSNSRPKLTRIRGAFFTSQLTVGIYADQNSFVSRNQSLWRYIGEDAKSVGGHRVGLHPVNVCAVMASVVVATWGAGMAISGMTNAHQMVLTNAALSDLDHAPDASARLRALRALQERIGFYEYRVKEHTPLLSRFGLNHDREVLNALWTPYARASRALLTAPVQQDIEARLVDLSQMPTTDLDDQVTKVAQDGQSALKTYLMMAEPQHADAAFMTPQLAQYWNIPANLTAGEKIDLSQHLLGFWAERLAAHPDWKIQPREDLISTGRQTLLAVIGVKNSEDTIYQGVLTAVGHKYPDQTLASLTAGTDTRGVFRTTVTVPGVFTRQAWEGSIEAAIDDAARHNGVAGDWVLGNAGTSSKAQTPEALRAALRRRYFADYAERWQSFMNSLRCDAAPTLPAAISQLKLIADARQSPMIALMKALEYQGGAGAQRDSLSDTLVGKAQSIFGKKDDTPQAAKPDPAGPLGASFGPVLRLVAQSSANVSAGARSDLSLERFTERVTSLRLKLQQISDSPDSDEQAKQIAQSLFLGKGSELADTLAYAQLIAASLGEEWAGMGAELFVRPVSQATQTVLQPAQASLNDAWQATIVANWNRSFAGRYPFANTSSDASLPELARFLRPQAGLIDTFLALQLAGVLQLQGDQWVPVAGATGSGSAAREIDPAFLKAINTLQRIGGHLLAQGEPSYRFELRPVPQPGITDTLLTIDAQKLHYYNQMETWSGMAWPTSDPQSAGTRLEWQTETAGTNQRFEFAGRWAFVRMLERAHVEPIDTSTYQLTWQAKAQFEDTRYASKTADAADQDVMRTDVGKGPLELLALKGFVLPSRIFVKRETPVKGAKLPDGPPPLPKAAIEAAKKAETPLPGARGTL
ncbi:ImcF domain-containing protein [Burkholderia sp. YI23]|nr:ImcF domain-containing protein [Burkholderia sp. YI23]